MAATTKPPSIPLDCIPAELRPLNQWVLWKYETREGKQTKVPYQANGKKAESDNPATWTSLEKALAALPRFDGLGIMFADGLAGVDLDHHVNGGQLDEYARKIIARLHSYSELSPSGEGVHILIWGSLPEGRRKDSTNGLEMYSSGRFFTFTGKHIEGTPVTVNERTTELAALHADTFKQSEQPKAKPQPTQPSGLDDQALLEKARAARNGAKFSSLYDGSWSAYYSSQSEADLGLCCNLVFWTAGDRARVDSLFRSSGLMREKWNERHNGNGKTYGEMTIDQAMTQQTDYYNPTTYRVEVEGEAPEEGNIMLTAPADHDGHALALLAMFPGKFLFVEAYGWLYYNGTHWQREAAESELGQAIIKTLRARRSVAAAAEKFDLMKACHGSNGNVAGTRDRLKDIVTELVDRFDNEPDKLNCKNGVLNLKTGQLEPHSPEQRFTYCLSVDYDPKADRSAWLAFLLDALGSKEMVDYLQVALGYSLTGQTWEEIMFYLFGPPRSGKGTYTETIIAMMGTPLAVEADFQTFTADRGGDTQNFDLAPLKPCRFVAAGESNKNQPLNPAKIKALTGRNYVRCAFKHRDHFQYQPAFKIWLSSNHPVNVDVDDDAAWGRVRVIHFPNSHLGNEDKALKARLTSPAVLRGVLAWAVEGAQLWYNLVENGGKGLPVPLEVEQITQEQRDQQDNVKAFIAECCANDPESYVTSADLYQAYKTWCENNGVTPKLLKQLLQSFERKGYKTGVQKKISNRVLRTVTGIKLLS